MRIIRLWKECGKRNWLVQLASKYKYYGVIRYAVERASRDVRYATEHTRKTFYFRTEADCSDWYEKEITNQEFNGQGFKLNN